MEGESFKRHVGQCRIEALTTNIRSNWHMQPTTPNLNSNDITILASEISAAGRHPAND
jgi:hypothetical protein